MRSLWLVPSLFVLVAGAAGAATHSVGADNGVEALTSAQLLTPRGVAPVVQGTVTLGDDARFTIRVDTQAPAYIYLVRCQQSSCQVDAQARRTQGGVPLLLSAPGGWLSLNLAGAQGSEELRVVAAAAPLSAETLQAQAGVPMVRREPETPPPDKRGLEAASAYLQENGVGIITFLVKKS